MSFQAEKRERIDRLVALCVKNNMTPRKPAFCDFIIRVSAATFSFDRRTTKAYVDILLSVWSVDHWLTIVKENMFIPEEGKKTWMSLHSQRY